MIAIISDIHGNFPALQSVLKKIHSLQCETIISLGDVAGYYCMINECINLLRENQVYNLMGNHDYYLLKSKACSRSRTANLCLEYQKKVITPENYKWLSLSKNFLRNGFVWALHGGWESFLEEYITTFDFEKCCSATEKIFCSGHTHIPLMEEKNGIKYFNPGSVGQPRDNNPQASFVTLSEKGEVNFYRVEYDIEKIESEMIICGLPKYICDCLYFGEKIGGPHTKYN